jgi:uncharacterized protein (UPF0335 family)
MADVGHNSEGAVDAGHLKAFIERVERLHEERTALSKDISEVYGEAKAMGFDAKALKEVVKLRGMDRDKRIEHETLVDLYMSSLGGL